MTDTGKRLISMREVVARTTLSRAYINELRAAGKFPRPYPLGPKRIAFDPAEIDAWIESRRAVRDEMATSGAQASPN